jgi:hypothetical protein
VSAALDAAATVAIYLAWAVVILGGVIALAAFASRWGLPNLPRRREERPVEATEGPPATTRSPAFAFPERPPAFDAGTEYLRAIRRAEIDLGIVVYYGTALDSFYDVRDVGPPGRSWDPDAFRGSLAERASDEVWTRIEIDAKGGAS